MKKFYSLLMIVLLAGLAAQAATNYGIKVAGVSVTSDNASNVTGSNISGTVTYNNSTKTLTMTNVTISLTSGSDRAILNTGCSGLIVKFVGTCKLITRNKAPIRTECKTTLSASTSSTAVTINGALEGAIFMTGSSHTLYIEGPGSFDIKTVYCPAIEGAEESGSGIQLQTPYYVEFSNVSAALGSSENDIRRIVNVTFNPNSHVVLEATNNSSYSTVSEVGCVFKGNETILAPIGAYAASDGTIKDANGNNIHDQDVYISDDYAFFINATNFPDANFRNYMLGLYPKGYMTQTDVQNLTSLSVYGKSISNMKGVEKLTYLQSLNCSANTISSLDLSSNTRLTNLSCYNNNMTSLNVNSCTQLVTLDCAPNKLTSLNLSNLTKLQSLYCYNNKLTSITFASSTPDLETVQCYGNNFTSFYLVSRPALKTLNISNCTSLETLHCYSNALTSLNVSGNTALTSFQCSYNTSLTSITGLAECTSIKTFRCPYTALTDLSAVNSMSNLEQLYCYYTNISTLNITNKSMLDNIDCTGCSNLATITITGNSALTALNAKNCTALTNLKCYSNALTMLNITGNTALKELRCYSNANLTAITGLTDCTAITLLDCENCSITSLNGVNNMTNIASLYARYNRLTTLTVTGKRYLTDLRVSGNTTLTSLTCYQNALNYLYVTGCTALTSLNCYGNAYLSTISGLGDCTNLVTLTAADCKLTSLNVANLSKLKTLICHHNQLTSLNVSGCTALTEIDCYMNRISGSGMTTLVNSLPTRTASNPGGLYVIYDTEENNSITSDQIAIASGKYWMPYYFNGSNWVAMSTASQPGDVNGDGNVNIGDVSALISYLLTEDATGINLANADVNGDGYVNIGDVSALINYLLTN